MNSESSDLIMNNLTSKTMKVYDIIEWNRYSGKQHSAMPIFTKEEAVKEFEQKVQVIKALLPKETRIVENPRFFQAYDSSGLFLSIKLDSFGN